MLYNTKCSLAFDITCGHASPSICRQFNQVEKVWARLCTCNKIYITYNQTYTAVYNITKSMYQSNFFKILRSFILMMMWPTKDYLRLRLVTDYQTELSYYSNIHIHVWILYSFDRLAATKHRVLLVLCDMLLLLITLIIWVAFSFTQFDYLFLNSKFIIPIILGTQV